MAKIPLIGNFIAFGIAISLFHATFTKWFISYIFALESGDSFIIVCVSIVSLVSAILLTSITHKKSEKEILSTDENKVMTLHSKIPAEKAA